MRAVLHAITTGGEERRGHLADAKSAVGKALQDAHSGEEWYLADHLRQGIKDVEARVRDASRRRASRRQSPWDNRPERSFPNAGTVLAGVDDSSDTWLTACGSDRLILVGATANRNRPPYLGL